ncbi:hypothetical protein [Bauldia sp.]|uniref:hypothetical protein n=1 Tax=Bauldia sp. TaxID=2575872 RepID=UPI003BAC1360
MTDRHAAPSKHPYARGAGLFAIAVGVVMILLWVWFIATGDVPELETRPLSAWFHVIGELATAALLIFTGWGLRTGASWAPRLYILATGMLLLAIIHAFAWYGERGAVGMVIALVALGVVAVFFALRAEE